MTATLCTLAYLAACAFVCRFMHVATRNEPETEDTRPLVYVRQFPENVEQSEMERSR